MIDDVKGFLEICKYNYICIILVYVIGTVICGLEQSSSSGVQGVITVK